MVDMATEMGSLPDQQVSMPTDYQTLGQQAFQSQVDPLRESYKKNLTGTLESLSQRGIAFGELGSENVKDLFKEQQKVEGNIATQIGTSLGLTQLEQAFQSSEAAKTRSLQKELSTAGFEFQAGENKLGRDFSAEQADIGRTFASEEAGKERAFTAEQTTGAQQFAALENTKQRDFGKSMAELEIAANQGNIQAQQEFQKGMQMLQNDFVAEQEQLRLDAQAGNLQSQQEFASREARLARDFGGDEAAAQREFMAEQNSIGRTFTSEEAVLQRTFQETFAANRESWQASEQDIARQEAKNQTALNLALSGNLDPTQIQGIVNEYFGEGVALTTNDEADLQRVATASGLTVEEYTTLREAIGAGQLADVMREGGVADYIESPAKARAFELNMAILQINAQRNAAGLGSLEVNPETMETTETLEGKSLENQYKDGDITKDEYIDQAYRNR